MTARCKQCNRYWNISILKRIPRSGYECPWCSGKKKKGELHMQQRLITVDKTEVEELRQQLDMLTREANTVSAEKSVMEIKACRMLLHKTMGILQSMELLELLPKADIELIREDHERIQNKILDILYEKRKALRVLQHK